ncbi:phosphatase PAP2 family protein [Actinomadura harenae]|uniref:Inositol phosphorylceramide synthase n=1 Tax=Actinomadura harenae TaxID=2483351 RepID=A0A3M2LHT5_9ACTN|nr:phosphatase PAP2 family protein [Actinomadura harenae]RMI36370.1 inositol phosphorylceramide synthase [Actinomadura harenae]
MNLLQQPVWRRVPSPRREPGTDAEPSPASSPDTRPAAPDAPAGSDTPEAPAAPATPGGQDAAPAPRRARFAASRPRALRELLLIAVLFGIYKAGRLAANDRVTEAFRNARDVWDIERWLHLPSELNVQDGLLKSHALIETANSYYAYVHFPATAAFLLFMYLRRPAYYRWVRWVVVALTAAGLALHLTVPLAPPRMLTFTGLIDTAAKYGPSVYGAPQSDTVANQYAAMPSLHIGWAIIVAVGLIVACRTRWRWLWLAHPVLTVLVVVSTANHYWLDGIVVTSLLAIVLLALAPLYRTARSAHVAGPRAEAEGARVR